MAKFNRKQSLRVRLVGELDQMWCRGEAWIDQRDDLRRWVELFSTAEHAERLRELSQEELIGVHLLAAAAFGECFKRALDRAAAELAEEQGNHHQGDGEC